MRRIAQLAKAHGVGVIFLFIPYYNGPDRLQELPLYRAIGPVMDAGFLAPHADLYADYGHLTRRGAQNVTDWMTGSVVASLIATAQGQRPQ